jgi:ferritin-like metal-binding protein YciE
LFEGGRNLRAPRDARRSADAGHWNARAAFPLAIWASAVSTHGTRKSNAMGLFTKDIKSMEDLYLHVLQDIYYAENQIKKALPDMIEKATNRELTAAFKSHLGETESQIKRLEQAFQLLGKEPKGTTCPAIDGIIKEANEVAGECDDKSVLDAALVAAAQAVEHYEITRYGTMIAWSEQLGRDAVGKLLTTNLNEEKAADKKLTTIGEKKVNLKAAG